MDSICDSSFIQSLCISNLRKQLLLNPSIVPAELLIQSRDHIPIIAVGFNSRLKNVQALYEQVTHSESLLRQMLSNATLRNLKDLASYCLEQGARLDTIYIYGIHRSTITGISFIPISFSSLKAWTLTIMWSTWAIY